MRVMYEFDAKDVAQLIADKFKARLYKRAEKLKKECASND